MCQGTECHDLYRTILWKSKKLHSVCKEAQKIDFNLEINDKTDTEASGSAKNWKNLSKIRAKTVWMKVEWRNSPRVILSK